MYKSGFPFATTLFLSPQTFKTFKTFSVKKETKEFVTLSTATKIFVLEKFLKGWILINLKKKIKINNKNVKCFQHIIIITTAVIEHVEEAGRAFILKSCVTSCETCWVTTATMMLFVQVVSVEMKWNRTNWWKIWEMISRMLELFLCLNKCWRETRRRGNNILGNSLISRHLNTTRWASPDTNCDASSLNVSRNKSVKTSSICFS